MYIDRGLLRTLAALTPSGWRILFILHERAIRPYDVASALGLHEVTVSRTLTKLVRAGLVTREDTGAYSCDDDTICRLLNEIARHFLGVKLETFLKLEAPGPVRLRR